jgi:radical SAM protein with 4Fe4S-binding SPASM domain
MSIIRTLKNAAITGLKKTSLGNDLFYRAKNFLGRLPTPDMGFPALINIEISSICNLHCIHCPPHMNIFKERIRKHNSMSLSTFNKIMDEIDRFGRRNISLHKDGEPLLHPDIENILHRVKLNQDHVVYLTTNGHKLNKRINEILLENKIDIINISLGAATSEFYEKVRGRDFNKVIANINCLLDDIKKTSYKPRVILQIIDLNEFPEMRDEIKIFKRTWQTRDVEISIWKKLNWGVFKEDSIFSYRYPCYSLWESFNINSNNVITACCMDWKQELVIGNIEDKSIEKIWKDDLLRRLRMMHINGEENKIELCKTCNYWSWQPKLMKYPLG